MANTNDPSRDPDRFLPLNPRVFMILMALAEGPAHGYEIRKRAESQSDHAVRLDAGSLYRTLAQLEDRAMIRETRDRPGEEEDDPRRRYYEMTEAGRVILGAEVNRLAGMVELARANDLLPAPGITP
jgi:DNA-binding PadR family transcriptional regulator